MHKNIKVRENESESERERKGGGAKSAGGRGEGLNEGRRTALNIKKILLINEE